MAYVVRHIARNGHGPLYGPNETPSLLQITQAAVGNVDLLSASPGSSIEHELSDVEFEDVTGVFQDEVGPDRILPTDDEFVTDVTKPVKIRLDLIGDEEDKRWPLISVPTLLRRQAELHGYKLAFEGLDHENR